MAALAALCVIVLAFVPSGASAASAR